MYKQLIKIKIKICRFLNFFGKNQEGHVLLKIKKKLPNVGCNMFEFQFEMKHN